MISITLTIIAIFTYVLITFYIFFYLFYKYIFISYKNSTTSFTIEELFLVLQTTINTEIDIYEKNIFINKGTLTTSNFENFYNDMCHNITTALSPQFYSNMSLFITEEALATIICRRVKEYLVTKVN